jgi:hypothetical protein
MEKGNPTPIEGPKKIGYSTEFTISGSGITLLLDSADPNVPSTINTDCTLTFNNSCSKPNLDDNADFRMVYQVVEDAGEPGREFEMMRDPNDQPSLIDKLVWWLSGVFGSNLAILNNPLKGVPGLPCNVVVVSDAQHLP